MRKRHKYLALLDTDDCGNKIGIGAILREQCRPLVQGATDNKSRVYMIEYARTKVEEMGCRLLQKQPHPGREAKRMRAKEGLPSLLRACRRSL